MGGMWKEVVVADHVTLRYGRFLPHLSQLIIHYQPKLPSLNEPETSFAQITVLTSQVLQPIASSKLLHLETEKKVTTHLSSTLHDYKHLQQFQ
jgi:hypothetical protein